MLSHVIVHSRQGLLSPLNMNRLLSLSVHTVRAPRTPPPSMRSHLLAGASHSPLQRSVVAAVVGDYPAGDCTELFLPQRLSPPLPAVVWLWVVAKTA